MLRLVHKKNVLIIHYILEVIIRMIISTKTIVSNSEMIKNYKSCREKSEVYGKIFILKNNQPDAVLMSINEYERLSEKIGRAHV